MSTSAHCILVSESSRKTSMLDGTTLYSQGEERNKISLNSGLQSPTASGFLHVANPEQLTCTHTSCAAAEGPYPLPAGDRYSSGLAKCHMTHCLKWNKRVHTESETGKDLPTQGDKSGTSYEDSFSLGKEVFQTQCPFLRG